LVATVLLWLLATVALRVAVPSVWAQHNVVDEGGYAALATSAAKEPALQQAMADELGSQMKKLVEGTGYDVSTEVLQGAARSYTASSVFPGHFAQVNRIAHRWIFTDADQRTDASGRWQVDLSPMLSDTSFQETLRQFGIRPPSTLEVPLTDDLSDDLRPGQLHWLAIWGPWISGVSTILAALFALLTLLAARNRGKAIAALGVSALLVCAAGYARAEVLRRRITDALTRTDSDIRGVADAMVDHAADSLHHWLNLTLAAGGVLVVFGVLVSMLGGSRRRDA
jgi:hypothetical protein